MDSYIRDLLDAAIQLSISNDTSGCPNATLLFYNFSHSHLLIPSNPGNFLPSIAQQPRKKFKHPKQNKIDELKSHKGSCRMEAWTWTVALKRKTCCSWPRGKDFDGARPLLHLLFLPSPMQPTCFVGRVTGKIQFNKIKMKQEILNYFNSLSSVLKM